MNHNKNRQNPSASQPKTAKHGQASHQVRIIGGAWKRTPLTVITAEGLRPTPDRVRETVFNWLNHLFDGQWGQVSCVDLFAGSGALGFEAASRGATKVSMIESFTPAYRQLEEVKQKLKADQIHLQRGDAQVALKTMATKGEKFELIFLDPPFHQGLLEKVLPQCVQILADGGVVYAESEHPLSSRDINELPTYCQGWNILREDKAGSVYFHLLQRNTESSESD